MTMNRLALAAVLSVPAIIVHSAWSSLFLNKYSRDTLKKIRLYEAAVFAVCSVVFVAWLYADPVNRDTRTLAYTVYHVNNGMWDAVLREDTKTLYKNFPDRAGALQLFMVHATNHALLQKGQIGEKLLNYPQAAFTYDPLLMLESTMKSGLANWIVVMNLAMDLGLVNTAEKIAGELMEKMGPYPDILYKRALIQIAKGNNEVASVYLGRLSHIPMYRKKAHHLLHEINNKSVVASVPQVVSMRASMDTVDYFMFNNESGSNILKYLLQSNLGNKAAYDYLMTHYLITGQLDNLTEIAPAASSFGYQHLPKNWEEAVCLNLAMKMMQESSENTSFSGISQKTVDRFKAFTNDYLPLEKDPQAAEKLKPAYGDTYFYFFIFRHASGVNHG
ncbi:MAG: DUF6057 family protein [Fibrobacterota bacterium]|nr:DUF6057 family protein [Chitinispirillaceae bacterium]